MPPGLEFGVYQRIIYLDLEPAAVRGDQCHRFDLRFEVFDQFFYQAHGPVCVVSNSAVGDLDF